MRVRIKRVSENQTQIILPHGGRVLNLWAPSLGGYVREVSDSRPGILGQQVSVHLAHSGEMMYLPKGSDLTDMVRRAARTRAGRENLGFRAMLGVR